MPSPKHRSIPPSRRMAPFTPAASFQTNGLALDWQSTDSGRAAADTCRRTRHPSQNTALRMRLGNLGTSQRAHYCPLNSSVGNSLFMLLGRLPLSPSLLDTGFMSLSAWCFPLSFLFFSLSLLLFSSCLFFPPLTIFSQPQGDSPTLAKITSS